MALSKAKRTHADELVDGGGAAADPTEARIHTGQTARRLFTGFGVEIPDGYRGVVVSLGEHGDRDVMAVIGARQRQPNIQIRQINGDAHASSRSKSAALLRGPTSLTKGTSSRGRPAADRCSVVSGGGVFNPCST